MRNAENDCAHFGATILSRMFQLDLGSLDSSVQPSQCVTVLSVKESYSYTIPSFSAITMKLRHVEIGVEENGQQAVYDSFFHEEHFEFGSTQEIVPKPVAIKKGCSVDVSCIRYR